MCRKKNLSPLRPGNKPATFRSHESGALPIGLHISTQSPSLCCPLFQSLYYSVRCRARDELQQWLETTKQPQFLYVVWHTFLKRQTEMDDDDAVTDVKQVSWVLAQYLLNRPCDISRRCLCWRFRDFFAGRCIKDYQDKITAEYRLRGTISETYWILLLSLWCR